VTPKRIAVVGAGNHSALHHGSALRTYAARHPGEIELAAVCDLDLARAAEYGARFGFARTYTDFREMIAGERPDGIVAVTPAGRTAAIARELLAFGIPLVIEKPPGETSAETLGLLHAARAHGTPHLVSFNRRFIPAVERAREWIAAGGSAREPRLVVGRMLRAARREVGFPVGTGIHLIDAVLSFLGAPRRVVTVRSPTAHADRYLYTASFDFGAGRGAAVVISPDVGTEAETLEIHGHGYAIQVDTIGCSVRIAGDGKEVLAWQPEDGTPYEEVCGALGETARFVAALRTGQGFFPDLAASLASMRAAEAVDAGGDVHLDTER
jgi:predicted dehydrogenase